MLRQRPQGGAKSDDGGGFAKGDILVVGLQDDASIPTTIGAFHEGTPIAGWFMMIYDDL